MFTETSSNQILVIGIVCVTVLELYALSVGIDGDLLGTVIGAILGASGIGALKSAKKK